MANETVTFAKAHNYGGHQFAVGDKLELPAARAKLLRASGALEVKKAPKKKGDE